MRFALCLLIVLASAPLAAREIKHSDANGACSSDERPIATARAADRKRAAIPQRETRVKPSQHGDADGGTGGRPQPLRWHSFLPGMVR